MPLDLVSIESHAAGFVASYKIRHSTPGREGTTLTCPLTLCVYPDRTSCVITTDVCEAATPDEALNRMAVWLRRLADGIEDRKASTPIPFG